MPGFSRLLPEYDIVIVGGGHAGLQAGLKATLLNHTAAIIDRGPKYSRSYYAPKMDNIPGFPEGISGHKLLDLQIEALKPYPSTGYFTPALVDVVRPGEGGFTVEFDWLKQRQSTKGRAVILAMGVVDRIPEVQGKIDPIFPWANFGIVDFCILCDGHTLPGKSVAVIGADRFAAETALDLLHFRPKSLEILTHGEPFLRDSPPEERERLEARLKEARVEHLDSLMVGFEGIREKEFHVQFADGTLRKYDRGFSGLWWYDMHTKIPRLLGCTFDPDGYVVTDEDCRAISAEGNPLPGLYVVGDLRNSWNQIPEAWANAERAVIHAYSYYL